MSDSKRDSIECDQLVDQICDEIESSLKRNAVVELDAFFGSVKLSTWPRLMKEIVHVYLDDRADASFSEFRKLLTIKQSELATLAEKIFAELTVNELGVSETKNKITVGMDEEGPEAESAPDIPQAIGRFPVERLLGMGGFGLVYLARDVQLGRQVVIKVPRKERFGSQSAFDSFIEEARKVAAFRHPGIVPVHEIGQEDGMPFIVQAYISGGDLRQRMKQGEMPKRLAVSIVAEVAMAIAEAHRQKIIHRDLKPENILLDERQKPLVADFGLALDEHQQQAAIGQVAGTLKYMSPEQVRGETHRMDGRSDIWSLGVILYRLLTGTAPFNAATSDALRQCILQSEARPLRQIDPSVPEELERICCRCLAKKMQSRYATAFDLAQELQNWLDGPPVATVPFSNNQTEAHATAASPPTPRQNVVPKGLLSFDERDRQFFLQLLPGLHNRGLPEANVTSTQTLAIPSSVLFWKDWMEETDERASPVGLIYGPSGCGKSSFVRAGVLPLLAERIATAFVDATAGDTEVRLLRALRAKFPDIPRDLSLPEIISGLRAGRWRRPGTKVVIVFDQFEQWLHGNPIESNCQLIEALRHCDGRNVQALILARDDFWMAVSRFFDELELPLQQQVNFTAIDLFDLEHAEYVLARFGHAFGKFPGKTLSEAELKFLKTAVKQIATQDRVICVRLILFAETIKSKPWTLETLRSIGSTHEIGALYLEKTISATDANPAYRSRETEIRKALACLLPDAGSVIKATLKGREEIAKVISCSSESPRLGSLLDILDRQLRLISPAEPDVGLLVDDSKSAGESEAAPTGYYQLSHDFLVPSVRAWLERKEREHPAGRARLRLRYLAEGWRESHDQHFMPSPLEFVAIARYVRLKQCSPDEKSLYQSAMRRYVGWTSAALCSLLLLLAVALMLRSGVRWQQAQLKAEQLRSAQPKAVPAVIDSMRAESEYAVKAIDEAMAMGSVTPEETIRLNLARICLGPMNLAAIESVVNQVEFLTLHETPTIVEGLGRNPEIASKAILSRYQGATSIEVKSQLALLLFQLGDDSLLLEACDRWIENDVPFSLAHDVRYMQRYWGDFIKWLDRMRSKAHVHAQLSPMVNGLAAAELYKLDPVARDQFANICLDLFQTSDSASLHSACENALLLLGVHVPEEKIQPGFPANPQREWMIDIFGQTFVRVRIPAGDLNAKINAWDEEGVSRTLHSESFWMASRPISRALFSRFRETPAHRTYFPKGLDVSRDPRAITNVDSVTMQAVCNWLSKEAGLPSAYVESDTPVATDSFVLDQIGEHYKTVNAWNLVENPIGYQLPNAQQWCYCAFQNRLAEVPQGGERDYAPDFGIHQVAPSGNAAPALPNCLGLFEVLGWPREVNSFNDTFGYVYWSYNEIDGPRQEPSIFTKLFPWRRDSNTGYRFLLRDVQ